MLVPACAGLIRADDLLEPSTRGHELVKELFAPAGLRCFASALPQQDLPRRDPAFAVPKDGEEGGLEEG